jgi:hypothetical protein
MLITLLAYLITVPHLFAQQAIFQDVPGIPAFKGVRVARRFAIADYGHMQQFDLTGTSLMPKAHGSAKMEPDKGQFKLNLDIRDLGPARQFGAEYLTYVVWAVTADGGQYNLGELVADGSRIKQSVQTSLSSFALIVTAEPDFAVKQPSSFVVMANSMATNRLGDPLNNVVVAPVDRSLPLMLVEARNAVNVARASGAERYATELFRKANQLLKQAEGVFAHNRENPQMVDGLARAAAQAAEEARTTTADAARRDRSRQGETSD